jgi:hypothetical protein
VNLNLRVASTYLGRQEVEVFLLETMKLNSIKVWTWELSVPPRYYLSQCEVPSILAGHHRTETSQADEFQSIVLLPPQCACYIALSCHSIHSGTHDHAHDHNHYHRHQHLYSHLPSSHGLLMTFPLLPGVSGTGVLFWIVSCIRSVPRRSNNVVISWCCI